MKSHFFTYAAVELASLIIRWFLFFFIVLLFSVSRVNAEILVPITIVKGGNLIHIARDYCTSRNDWKKLAEINDLKDPYLIYPGAALQIPLSLLLTEKLSAQVGSVNGGVFLVEKDSRLRQLKKGDTILPGQTVVTEKEGFASLIFPDNKFTRIASESRFTITYLVRLTDKSMKAEFFLEQGRIVHAVKKKLRQNETFKTRTLVSITGVRGTEFRLKIEAKGTNFVETLGGTVEVRGDGEPLALKEGEGIQIEEGGAMGKPRKLPASPSLPELKEIYRTLPVVFPAPVGENFRYLRLRITGDRQGTETVLEQVVSPGDNFTLLSLEDRTYYGFLTAIDSFNYESLPAGPFAVQVRTVPSVPVLLTPSDGKVIFDKEVTAQWLKGAQAEQFFFQLGRDKEFKEIVEEKIVHTPVYTTPRLEPGEYFFKVQSIAEDGFRSYFSLIDSWTISESPSLGELEPSTGNRVSLHWNTMGEGITYDLQVGGDKEFRDLVVDQPDLREPLFTLSNSLSPGNYYVRIRGVLGDGQVSPWTPYQMLKIEPGPFAWIEVGLILAFLGIILI